MFHLPVLKEKVIEFLNPKPVDGFWVDATLGGGGHSFEIAKRIIPFGKLICIDQDPDAIKEGRKRLKDFEDYTVFVNDNFSNLKKILLSMNINSIKGIIYDLGVSSHQIDTPEKGFSYLKTGPLSMKMNPNGSISAFDVVNKFEQEKLSEIFSKFGQEHYAKRIAKAIVLNRPINSTTELSEVIKKATPRKDHINSLSRVFQAIRIFVNSEIDNLKRALEDSIDALEKGGKIVVISYHSIEDKIVKDEFKKESKNCICGGASPVCICNHKRKITILTKKPILPDLEEINSNPRARSAKLRAAEKI